MTNLFGEEQLRNGEYRKICELYIEKKLSEAERQAQSDELMELFSTTKTFKMSILSIATQLSLVLGAAGIIGIILSLIYLHSFEQAYENAPIVFWVVPVSLIAFLILKSIKRPHQISEEDELILTEQLKIVSEKYGETMERFGVPATAVLIELFSSRYVVVNGESTLTRYNNADFFVIDYFAYVQDNCLKFYGDGEVVAVPLNDLMSIKRIDRAASTAFWSRDLSTMDDKFADSILISKHNNTVFRYYYSLQLQGDKGSFEILFPPYEIDKILSLTKLTYSEELF